ncbi:LysR substrate-binding domain-containing protein [Pantoea sp. GD03673]|uniref:LysR family transcriptional regulator n=1 Tax=Pantoea sp. GD03673 TaxID=2975364 RepID=UPI0024486584|nr:LysR substrate-binding domain-containing protein [Pantoea sp. GD03673]MDH2066207.1 LysR substrate-binding domain-containing protein [Pantoea sp. GD03673]
MSLAAHLISSHLPTIRQLQCFLAVAHELNFRRAAERLSMTQPPLTRQIQRLEDLLGQSLFCRSTHEVTLTDSGRALVAQAEAILIALSALKQDAQPAGGRLRIGMTRTLNAELMPPLNRQLAALHASDEMAMPSLTSAQLLQSLAKNQLDVIITGERGPDAENAVQYAWVYQEPLLVAMPSAHPASLTEKVTLESLADLPLFWFPRSANPLFYDKCERYFATLSITLKRIREPEDSLLMLSHIARGKGFALMPQSTCTFNQAGLCYRPLAERAARQLMIDVYAAIRADEKNEAVLNALKRLSLPADGDDALPDPRR